MTRRILLGAMAFLSASAAPQGAEAGQACITRPGPRAAVTGFLTRCCGEVHVETRIQGDGTALEFWANPATGTWSMLATSPVGLACLTATGRGWRPIPSTAT